MLIIYVDADACAVKDEIYRVARRYGMRVAVVANAPAEVPADALVELVVCPGFGAADDWIAQQAGLGDIVVHRGTSRWRPAAWPRKPAFWMPKGDRSRRT